MIRFPIRLAGLWCKRRESSETKSIGIIAGKVASTVLHDTTLGFYFHPDTTYVIEYEVTERLVMLVLGRRKNQSIVIGDEIEVLIVEIDGENVEVGVQAPRHIQIYRKELLKEIELANIKAAVTKKPEFPLRNLKNLNNSPKDS